jgi:hypothetical protein
MSFEQLVTEIHEEIKSLRKCKGPEATAAPPTTHRERMSEEGRGRHAEAQRRRRTAEEGTTAAKDELSSTSRTSALKMRHRAAS